MRFTIRDVLWFTVLVALAVGWWLDDSALRSRLEFQKKESEEWMETAIKVSEDARRRQQAAEAQALPTGGGFPGSSFSGFPSGRPKQSP